MKDRGFTLIEILMIIVVVSISFPALLLMLGQGVKQRVRAEIGISATQVAQAMLEEIKSKNWDEYPPTPPGRYTSPPAPEAGEGRQLCTGSAVGLPYDDVDDYHGYAESCTWGGISYVTAVSVCYVDPADLQTCAGLSDYKRVTVTVSHATIGAIELVTVVTNY